jgi:Na+-driven multidrug efflux pump
MSYLKKDPIDDLNDLSLVNPEIEKKSRFSLAAEIVGDSIFNIFPILLLVLTDSLNLIFVGHIKNESSHVNNFFTFNFFQIGVIYLNLFGFIFALGTLKSLNKETINKREHYVHSKIIIYLLIFIVIIPLMLAGYVVLNYLYSTEQATQSDTFTQIYIWYVYKSFILYSPLFMFPLLLFQLNLKIFQIYNMRIHAFWICLLFIFLHCIISYVLIFVWNFNLKGILVSLSICSFLCYTLTDMIINDNIFTMNGNFYLIPTMNFTWAEFYETIKNSFTCGAISYLEYAGFGFFLLFSYFVDHASLTTNIILLNFFTILHVLGQGFSSTLKHYINLSMSSYKHSHKGKKKYVKILSVVVFVTALVFALVIFIFDGCLVNIYLHQGHANISEKFNQIAYFYAIIIFFDYLSQVLDGYVKGINTKTYLLFYKLAFLLFFLPLGLGLCFAYNLGIFGFWLATYLYIVIYTVINGIYVYKHYELWTG